MAEMLEQREMVSFEDQGLDLDDTVTITVIAVNGHG